MGFNIRHKHFKILPKDTRVNLNIVVNCQTADTLGYLHKKNGLLPVLRKSLCYYRQHPISKVDNRH